LLHIRFGLPKHKDADQIPVEFEAAPYQGLRNNHISHEGGAEAERRRGNPDIFRGGADADKLEAIARESAGHASRRAANAWRRAAARLSRPWLNTPRFSTNTATGACRSTAADSLTVEAYWGTRL
jgi:hypothetical protein